jgi:hypothetical protein
MHFLQTDPMNHKPGPTTPHFNALSPSEAERLVCMAEECAEIIQIIHKIQRHGLASRNPIKPGPSNIELLEKEIGHFELWLVEMINQRDLDPIAINQATEEKRRQINAWLHHNRIDQK